MNAETKQPTQEDTESRAKRAVKFGKKLLAFGGVSVVAFVGANKLGVDFPGDGPEGNLTGDVPAEVRDRTEEASKKAEPGVREQIEADKREADMIAAGQDRAVDAQADQTAQQDELQMKQFYEGNPIPPGANSNNTNTTSNP